VIAALQARDLGHGDRGHRDAAVALLRLTQGLGGSPLQLEARIRLAAEAARRLGFIQNAEISPERTAIGRVIASWERAWYERSRGVVQSLHELTDVTRVIP
jgi:hypothetical protein